MKLGSLFDGSGGFPLAGVINGIEPVWASEIEPYPLKVTAARFPHVKQLGDVTKINGAEIDPVDVITFGSPCQDLSVAGKQAGIHDGARSNLFFEAVRIIKEMRAKDAAAGRTDEHCRPRFEVWENVPGAFSSNKGADFQAVLQALAEVRATDVSVPMPPKGKWSKAGCVVGDGWSIAWRVYDAQYWGITIRDRDTGHVRQAGTPQRRKRIYLVADFASERAGEILFERESVCGNPAQSQEAWKRASGHAERCSIGSNREGLGDNLSGCLNPQDPESKRIFGVGGSCQSLYAGEGGGGRLFGVCYAIDSYSSNSMKSPNPHSGFHETDYAKCLDTSGGEAALCVFDCRGNGATVPTLTGDHQNRVTDYTALCVGNGQLNQISMSEKCNTLDCMHDQQAVITNGKHPRKYIVRRLTPLECCRLQGFPDWWEDGVEGSDSARYKMWGNGIALPCAVDVLRRVAKAGASDA